MKWYSYTFHCFTTPKLYWVLLREYSFKYLIPQWLEALMITISEVYNTKL